MESRSLAFSIFVLFSLALAGESHARAWLSDEDYWQAVWPNTPIPDSLRDLLKPGQSGVENVNRLPMKKIEDTQYPTNFFFNKELYPGKTMNVEFSMHRLTQPYGVYFWVHGHDVKDIKKEAYTPEQLCLREGPKGEDKYCAESLETLMNFVISKLGKNVQAFSSSFLSKQEEYTVEGVQNLGGKAVMCHRLNFQKAVFYCHEVHETKAFMVPLVAGDGTKTQALAVCHFDTSVLNFELFRQIMKVDPGTNPLCHFLGNKSILWVPNLAMEGASQTNFVV